MKKELTMEMRLLIAFALMGIVLIGAQYLLPQPEPVAETAPQTAQTEEAAGKAAPAPAAPAAATPQTPAAPPAELPGAVSAEAEQTVEVETDRFKVEFSNLGAVVRSWVLKDYVDSQGKPLDLVNKRALELSGTKAVPPPFAIAFLAQAPSNDPNDDLFQVQTADDGHTVTFEYSDGRTSTKKSFAFHEGSYLVDVSSQVLENGVLLPHSLEWRGGFGDNTVVNAARDARTLYYDEPNKDLNKNDAGDADDGPISSSGLYAFAGIEDKYFVAAADLPQGTTFQITTFADQVPDKDDKDQARVGMAIGGSGSNMFPLYVGPKDSDTLAGFDPRLKEVIDWGWFWFLAQPLFYALAWTADAVTHNYGWAIMLITIVINTVLFPLKISSMKSSKKMQALQPQISAINAKYKEMSMKDPRKQKQQEELMEIYKKNDVNPVGGCVPMLFQMPFIYALYKVLGVSINLRGAEWLWVTDLSQPETLSIRILPVLLMVTQFAAQKMTPSPGVDPTQQKMMMLMPLVFGYMFWFQSSGLVLYWLTGNLVSIVQQWLLNRSTPAPAVAVAAPVSKKRK